MKVLTSVIALMLLCLFSPLLAQDTCEDVDPIGLDVKIIPNPASAPNIFPGDEFCLSFCAQNFTRVEVFMINIGFDPELVTVESGPQISPGLSGLAEVNANTLFTDQGILPLIFLQLATDPITLADGEEVMRVCFEAEDLPGQSSDVTALPPTALPSGTFDAFVNVVLDNNTQCTLPIEFNSSGTTIDIGCERISVVDLNICHPTGSITFGSCGGTFPVDYSLDGTAISGTLTDINDFATIDGLAASPFYNLILIDADGNRVDRTFEVLDNIDPILLNPQLTNPLCANSNNGVISYDITGGDGDYNVRFTSGITLLDGIGSVSNLPNGSYSVTVTDGSGCSAEFSGLDLFTPPLVVDDVAVDSFRCLFAPDGCLFLNVSGGTPINGDQYNINSIVTNSFEQCDPMNQPFLFNEQNICFEVTIMDDNGCELRDCIPLPIMERIPFSFDTIPPDCNSIGYNSQIEILNNQRVLFELSGPMGFETTFGNNSIQFAEDLPPGNYTWSLTELPGTPGSCRESVEFTIPDFSVNLLELTTMSTQPMCGENNGIAVVNATGGQMPYAYNWEVDPTLDQNTLDNLPAGIYNVTVTDGSGCSQETMVDLQQGVFLTVEADIIQDLDCTDPTVQAELEVMFMGFDLSELEFNWSTESESNLSDTPVLVTDTAGVYIVEVSTLTGTCTLTDTITLAQPTLLTFQTSSIEPALCDPTNPLPGRIEISNIEGGSGFYRCEWSLDGDPLPPPSPGNFDCFREDLGPGNYEITIIDNTTGCRTTEQLTLNNNDNVAFTFNILEPDCPGSENAQISVGGFAGGPDLTCTWADPTISVSNCVASNLTAGAYDVNIMDDNGCNKDTTFVVMDPIIFEAEIIDSISTSCNGGNDGSATVMITSNPQSLTDFIYLWNGVQGTMTGLTATQDDLPAGDNVLTIVGNNCSIDLEFSIPNPSSIVLDNRDAMVLTQCAGECTGSVTLDISGGTSTSGDYTVTWLSDGFSGQTRNDLCPGTQVVMIEDDNSCMQLDSVIVLEQNALDFDFVNVRNVGCSNGEGGAIQVNADGGCGDFTFEWTNNISITNTAEDLVPGAYSITVTDACGCTQEIDTMVLGETPLFAELDIRNDGACPGDLVCVGINPNTITGGSGSGYTFTIDSGTLGERVPIDSCLMILPGPHTVTVFDNSTPPCSFDFGLVDIPGPNPLTIDIGPEEINTSIGEEPLELSADISADSGIIGIIWSPEEVMCTDSTFCDEVLLTPIRSTIISAIVTDENGCTARDDIFLTVDAVRRVYLPNTFEPGTQGNERFMILTGPGVVEIQDFLIYDRWGNVVFELPEAAKPFPHTIDDGWDGRNGARQYESGVYGWIATILFSDGEVITFNGGVTLVR